MEICPNILIDRNGYKWYVDDDEVVRMYVNDEIEFVSADRNAVKLKGDDDAV